VYVVFTQLAVLFTAWSTDFGPPKDSNAQSTFSVRTCRQSRLFAEARRGKKEDRIATCAGLRGNRMIEVEGMRRGKIYGRERQSSTKEQKQAPGPKRKNERKWMWL